MLPKGNLLYLNIDIYRINQIQFKGIGNLCFMMKKNYLN